MFSTSSHPFWNIVKYGSQLNSQHNGTWKTDRTMIMVRYHCHTDLGLNHDEEMIDLFTSDCQLTIRDGGWSLLLRHACLTVCKRRTHNKKCDIRFHSNITRRSQCRRGRRQGYSEVSNLVELSHLKMKKPRPWVLRTTEGATVHCMS